MLVYIIHVFGFVGKEFKEKTLNEKNHFSKKKKYKYIFQNVQKRTHSILLSSISCRNRQTKRLVGNRLTLFSTICASLPFTTYASTPPSMCFLKLIGSPTTAHLEINSEKEEDELVVLTSKRRTH